MKKLILTICLVAVTCMGADLVVIGTKLVNTGSGVLIRPPWTPAQIQTTAWASEVVELKDGRFGFPRIPDAVLDALGIPEATREAFYTAFQWDVVVVTGDMLKEE